MVPEPATTPPTGCRPSTFSGKLRLHEEDDVILGVLSLVFWTLTLIPLCKYIITVLGADDNGEGGTFALYSLLRRCTKLGLSSAPHATADAYSPGTSETPLGETTGSLLVKEFFDKYHHLQVLLLLVVLLGTSLVIGNVLSAVNGIKAKAKGLHENYTILIACLILVGLFALQHFGTHRAGKDGWSSHGGVVLCITGAEAMFADLRHFSQLPIWIAFTTVVYASLVVAYMCEAAYYSKHTMDLERSFFKAIPEAVFWPISVIATLATAVASQAITSATLSIISQFRALRCFPRVKVIHTSSQIHGQIYISEVNWILMVPCIAVGVGFRDADMIGNTYGLAVIAVMFVTTCLMFLVIVMVWKGSVLAALAFVVIFGSLELLL